MKARIANSSWRFIHWFSWLAVVAAIVHGFMTGTDSRSGIGLGVVIACACAVFSSALWRFAKRPARALGRTALSPLAPEVAEENPPKGHVDHSKRRNRARR
jgi:peptidoglycan/LPS O-acetylase OafA/YrhL